MKDILKVFGGCLIVIVLIILVGALEGFIFMLLWNWLMPLLWETAPIFNIWQAWGLLILFNIILLPLKNRNNK